MEKERNLIPADDENSIRHKKLHFFLKKPFLLVGQALNSLAYQRRLTYYQHLLLTFYQHF